MVKKIMPIPPIHCDRLRHMRMLCGWASQLSMTVAPVEVNPDMVSKKALVISGNAPLKRKGNIPATEKAIHESVTTR